MGGRKSKGSTKGCPEGNTLGVKYIKRPVREGSHPPNRQDAPREPNATIHYQDKTYCQDPLPRRNAKTHYQDPLPRPTAKRTHCQDPLPRPNAKTHCQKDPPPRPTPELVPRILIMTGKPGCAVRWTRRDTEN